MNGDKTSKGSPEAFRLEPSDIDHLFSRSGLSGNSLSIFRFDGEQDESSSPSESFEAIAGSSKLKQICGLLFEPDLRIEFNSGGGGSADDRYYALLSRVDKSVLCQFLSSEKDIILLLHPDWESFLEWWAGVYVPKGMGGYQPVFPGTMEIEVLVCALQCIDTYRRSYMESMLDYRSGLDSSLTTQDFVGLLKRSLASRDKRWLLPTMFEITPGLKNSSISLKPEHIRKVEELGFIKTDESTLTLFERSRLMGTEFITSWMGSFGLQATDLVNGKERSLSRVFMVSTAFTNHIFSFVTGADGETRFRHQASTSEELIKMMMKWMAGLQGVTSPASSQTANISVPEQTPSKDGVVNASKARFCSQCGSEITPGKKFCRKCGTAVR